MITGIEPPDCAHRLTAQQYKSYPAIKQTVILPDIIEHHVGAYGFRFC
ncbi:MAG: hypothetical protein SCK70_10205 [bacterium]|nr:hypothetical protein [bacterium]